MQFVDPDRIKQSDRVQAASFALHSHRRQHHRYYYDDYVRHHHYHGQIFRF